MNTFLKVGYYLFTICIALIFSSCKQPIDFIGNYMKNYSDVSNKKLDFKSEYVILNKGFDRIDFNSSNFKLICTGYMECSPCVGRLIECDEFLLENTVFAKKVDTYFIVSGLKSDYFDYQIKHNSFSFPILYDSTASFIIENGLENYDKSVLLLNAKNQVVLVGSPFENAILEKYFKQSIE